MFMEGQLTAEVVQCADESQSYGCNKTHRWPQNKGTTAIWSKHTGQGHGYRIYIDMVLYEGLPDWGWIYY